MINIIACCLVVGLGLGLGLNLLSCWLMVVHMLVVVHTTCRCHCHTANVGLKSDGKRWKPNYWQKWNKPALSQNPIKC